MILSDEHVIKGSVLDDIQHNHCRWNVNFHLVFFASRVISVLYAEDNKAVREQIEEEIKNTDPEILDIVINHYFDELANRYLDEDMGYGEDYWDEESEEEE